MSRCPRSFEAAWGTPLSRRPGYKVPEMFDAAVAGELKAMYIFGEDVAQTDPDSAHVARALEALEFLVCQDIFPNETTAHADVILPASSFLEKRARSRTPSAASSSSSRCSTRRERRGPTWTSSPPCPVRWDTRWGTARRAT